MVLFISHRFHYLNCLSFSPRLKRKEAKYLDDYVVIDSQRKKRKSKKKKSSKKLIKADADEAAEAAKVVDRIEDDDQGNFMLNHDFWAGS